MPRKKNPETKAKAPKKVKKVVVQQSLEDILFECRNKLRGNANMTTKRDILLTLVFLRFIGSRFNEQREKIKATILASLGKTEEELTEEDKYFINLMMEDKSSYLKDGIFYLKDSYNWDKLIVKEPKELSTALDTATTDLMKEEDSLKNALPTNLFVNARLETSVLKGVMDDVNKIDPLNFKDIDLIGRVYEYFLQQFAINATKEEGEFYTPQSIVELIASLIEPFDGKLYDPCCGSGGMFVQSVRLVEAHGGNKNTITVYGQESDPDTYRLAKMNLAARGISYHLGDTFASSFTHDQHPTLRSEYIMANPPFNKKDWYDTKLANDRRWEGYDIPPASNANYAWILHMLYHLDPTKGIAGFLLSNGALEDEDTIEIRKKLIQNDKVEAIFILPREMFYTTDTSVSLWILNQNKKGGPWHGHNLRNRQGEVLFVDLRRWTESTSTLKTDKSKKTVYVFNEEQIEKIVAIYRNWQLNINGEYDKAELFHSASVADIEANNWSLVPSRYVRFEDRDVKLDYDEVLTKAGQRITKIIEAQNDNSKQLLNALKTLGYGND